MIEGLPFLFDTGRDDHFDGGSMAYQNLNNSDPDLLCTDDCVECDTYKDLDLLNPIEEVNQDQHRIGGENFMRYALPFIEVMTHGDADVPKLGLSQTTTVEAPIRPISMKEALALSSKKTRQPALPKRPFERLVDKVISGEVNINDF